MLDQATAQVLVEDGIGFLGKDGPDPVWEEGDRCAVQVYDDLGPHQ